MTTEQKKRYMKAWVKKNRDKTAAYSKKWRLNRDPIAEMFHLARCRARERDVQFTITKDDIKRVTHCPILGIELTYQRNGTGKAQINTASLDRIDNEKGYIPGNVQIISWRANELKRNITLVEMKALAAYYLRMNQDDPKSWVGKVIKV